MRNNQIQIIRRSIPKGSRYFNKDRQHISWSSVFDMTGSPLSVSFWIKSLFDGGAIQGTFQIVGSGGTTGFLIYLSSGTGIWAQRGSGANAVYVGQATWPTIYNVWTNVIVTHDGTQTDYTTLKIYRDGSLLSSVQGSQNGSGTPDVSSVYYIGGVFGSNSYDYIGYLSAIGVWNRVISGSEITNLKNGWSPGKISSGLKFHWKGNTSSLTEEVTSGTGTATGTTFSADGPTIIY